jgi:hypothetical protein
MGTAGWLSAPGIWGVFHQWVLASLLSVSLVLLHITIRTSEESINRPDEPVAVEAVSERRGTMKRTGIVLQRVVNSVGHFVWAVGADILAASTLGR